MLYGTGPIGVVLAGGRGRRMGGDKAAVQLRGRPLAQWVADALGAVLADVVIACRMETELPTLTGVAEAWIPSGGPRGPVAGLAAALREAQGRPVLACSISLPLIRPETIRALALADAGGAAAVVPECDGHVEALVGRWEPAALGVLDRLPPDASLLTAAHAAAGRRLPLEGIADQMLRVEAPEDLLRAGAALASAPCAAPRPSSHRS